MSSRPASLWLPAVAMLLLVLLALSLNTFYAGRLLAARQEFDRQNLFRILSPDTYQTDLLVDIIPLSPAMTAEDSPFINLELLGLRRERLAYLGRVDGEVEAVILPLTIDDGFNGWIDLLLGIDMYGSIEAARVIAETEDSSRYGTVEILDSRWMEDFTGSSMRDLRRPSWQPIKHDDGYDQFVGASITPKAVAAGMYDAMVFFQTNRMVLMAGGKTPATR